jgi:hypothetical protein
LDRSQQAVLPKVVDVAEVLVLQQFVTTIGSLTIKVTDSHERHRVP